LIPFIGGWITNLKTQGIKGLRSLTRIATLAANPERILTRQLNVDAVIAGESLFKRLRRPQMSGLPMSAALEALSVGDGKIVE
jgi:ABC-type hemin transport system substrate-binding protein